MKIKLLIFTMLIGLTASAQFANFNQYGVQKATTGDSLRLVDSTVGQYLYLPTTKMLRDGITLSKNVINVTDYGAKPDGTTVNDVYIASAIAASTKGQSIYFPKGTYVVKENILLNKKGLKIFGNAVLKQVTNSSQVPSGDYPYSNFPMFKVLADSISIEGLTFYPKFEAISTLGYDGLFINKVNIIGTGQSIFPGVFFKDSKHIEVKGSTIKNIGVRSSLTQRSGHGIHINTSDYIKIYDCDIENNGGNGVFSFVSSNIRVENNRISRNGMSAFQLAFAPDTSYIQRNYFINNNLMQGNAADGIDVNNSGSLRTIDMFITNNVLKDNGFFNGLATVDGSGIGTFINVGNVNLTANKSYNNAGIGLYIYQSKDIVATDNVLNKTSVGSGIYAENSSFITLKGNTVNTQSASLRFTGNNSFVKISNNHFTSSASVSLEYPNDAILNSYSIDHNDFTGVNTINGLFDLYYNNIISTSTQIALGLYNSGRTLEGNKISSLGTALDITNVSNSYLKGNVLIGGSGSGSFPTLTVSGAENTTLDNNSVTALNDDPAMLVSSTINKLTLFNNTFYGASGNNIRYNPGSLINVYQTGTTLNGGFFEPGSAIINDVQYNVNGNITSTGQAGFVLTNGSTWNFNSDANRLYINETGVATRLQIEKTTGYVGIGRTPNDVFHVAGNIKSDGKVIIANAPVNPTDGVRKQELDLKANLNGGNTFSGLQTFQNNVSFSGSSITSFNSSPQIKSGLDVYNTNSALTQILPDNSVGGSAPTVSLTWPTTSGKFALLSDLSAYQTLGNLSNVISASSTLYPSNNAVINYTTGNFIKQGGNSFGAGMVIGTNDNQDVAIKRNGVVYQTITSAASSFGLPVRLTYANDGEANTAVKNSDLIGIANESILSKTANYTITQADLGNVNTTVVYANAASGNITITLPSVAISTGRKIVIFKTDATANTITITGAANINGSATYTVTPQYSSVEIHANGTQYYAK